MLYLYNWGMSELGHDISTNSVRRKKTRNFRYKSSSQRAEEFQIWRFSAIGRYRDVPCKLICWGLAKQEKDK